MGQVWQATDTKLNGRVALKICWKRLRAGQRQHQRVSGRGRAVARRASDTDDDVWFNHVHLNKACPLVGRSSRAQLLEYYCR